MTDATPSDLPPVPDRAHDAKVHAAELWISNILRVGVWLSLALIVIGTAITFTHHPDYHTATTQLSRLTNPGDRVPHHLGDIWTGLREGRGQAIVSLGLLTLIATPVVRVATSVFAFVAMRDRRFVVITLIVLTLLIISFWLGRAEA